MRAILTSRWSLLALAFALTIIGIGVVFRPYWRDEYWVLYFSAPHLPFEQAVAERMVRDVHPPLYFVLQHFWRLVSEAELWARIFNALWVPIGALGVWLLGRARREETLLFLLLCAGSYWVIYYAIELRMYLMLFALCAMSVIVVRNALEPGAPIWRHALLFALIGAAAGMTQFFGALWTAVLGAWTGLALARAKRFDGFFAWALASLLAIAPALAWILIVRPDTNPGAGSNPQTFAESFTFAANQFLRGLVVKTFGSNLAAAALLFVTGAALLRRRSAIDLVLALSVASVVAIAFALHLTLIGALIKERAFIVIMPAIIFLIVRAIDLSASTDRSPRLRAAIPIAALLSPLLFLGEYAKDREHWGEVRAMIRAAGPGCAGAPVIMYNRPSLQAADFHRFVTVTALQGAAAGGADLALADVDDLIAAGQAAPAASGCAIRAVALALPKGDGDDHAAARARLRAIGLPPEDLAEHRIAGGRQLVWSTPPGPP